MEKKQLISENEVKDVIDRAEKSFNECFDMLLDFRHARDSMINAFREFQPKLAECLYNLMTFSQELQKEKAELISTKANYDRAVFTKIMKTNAKYLNVIKKAIEIGKDLGDAFAWFFFRNNRDELEKHFNHEPTGLYVSGIGGKGELEFIKNNTLIDGFYVLYHGITTMLRIGDYSLYDFHNGIIGVVELKTKKIENTLNISAAVTSKCEVHASSEKLQGKSFKERTSDIKQDFPRIERQLKEHDELLKKTKSDISADHFTSYEHSIVDLLHPDSPVVLNSDNSLLLLGVWNKSNSLFDILFKEDDDYTLPTDKMEQKVFDLMTPSSPYNMMFIGELNITINQFSIPILWWDIDDKTCRDLYFKKLEITTMFNPAKLIQFFLDDGFSVTTASSLDKFEIYKMIDNKKISIEHFDTICQLITKTIMKTKDVYSFIKEVMEANYDEGMPIAKKIEMHIRLNSFGYPENQKGNGDNG